MYFFFLSVISRKTSRGAGKWDSKGRKQIQGLLLATRLSYSCRQLNRSEEFWKDSVSPTSGYINITYLSIYSWSPPPRDSNSLIWGWVVRICTSNSCTVVMLMLQVRGSHFEWCRKWFWGSYPAQKESELEYLPTNFHQSLF